MLAQESKLPKVEETAFDSTIFSANSKVRWAKPDCKQKIELLGAVYGLAIKALKEFSRGNLYKMDPLLTDGSCHLRAVMIQMISQKIISEPKNNLLLETKIKDLQGKITSINSLLENWADALQKMKSFSNTEEHINKILSHLNLSVSLPNDFIYVIQAYFLTLTKDYKKITADDGIKCAEAGCAELIQSKDNVYREQTKVEQLEKGLFSALEGKTKKKLPTKSVKVVYNYLKEQLIQDSTKYVLEELEKVDQKAAEKLKSTAIVGNEIKIQFSDFFSLTSVFNSLCIKKKIPVVLKICECYHSHKYQEIDNVSDLAFYLKPKNGRFVIEKLPGKSKWNRPVIVVQGKRSGKEIRNEETEDYLRRFLEDFDFAHQCEMDGAQHVQYSNGPDEIPNLTNEEKIKLEKLKEEANRKGSSLSNQKKLVFAHVFADSLKNQIAEAEEIFKNTYRNLDLQE